MVAARIINVALLLIALASGYSLFNLVTSDTEDYLMSTANLLSRLNEQQVETATAETMQSTLSDQQAYLVINNKNLFHPSREPISVEEPSEPEPPPEEPALEEAPPSMTLVGTIISGDLKVALISEASIKNGATKQYKITESVLDFTITDVKPDRVLLKTATDKEIMLKLRRGTTKPARPARRQAARANPGQAADPQQAEAQQPRNPRRRSRPNMAQQSTGGELPFPLPGMK